MLQTLRTAMLAAPLLLLPGLAAAQAPAAPAAPAAPTSAVRGASPIFDGVRARDHIRCGVSQGTPGFSVPDSQGVWRGFDADYCRALAAAVLGDPNKVRFTPYSAQARFTALQSGEIDVLSRNTTYTFVRDVQLGLEFPAIIYYDGAGFLARRQPGLTSARGLDGATVCVQTGSTNELIVGDFGRANNIRLNPLVMQNLEEIFQALFSGRCDAMNWDRGALAGTLQRAPNPADFVILPEVLSKEPYSPVVAQGDQRWLEIVRWVAFGLIEAEELGITAANADSRLTSTDPGVQRLLGVSGGFGAMLGIDNRWMLNAIKAVGNWNEVFERNLAPLGIDRGVNRLWSAGGALYAPAFR
ncbi:amino acid ABC transporter substrate-binding protein [Humitalea sp. 24SJ18S-53]|uniref:amino acid ABC transporter substrate-binding protein n=1 Tax=Humitalea sp. 24SJ18S-53 TaxID=3422307 RepID=UPI003D672142